jgi:hypothetical protein
MLPGKHFIFVLKLLLEELVDFLVRLILKFQLGIDTEIMSFHYLIRWPLLKQTQILIYVWNLNLSA